MDMNAECDKHQLTINLRVDDASAILCSTSRRIMTNEMYGQQNNLRKDLTKGEKHAYNCGSQKRT